MLDFVSNIKNGDFGMGDTYWDFTGSGEVIQLYPLHGVGTGQFAAKISQGLQQEVTLSPPTDPEIDIEDYVICIQAGVSVDTTTTDVLSTNPKTDMYLGYIDTSDNTKIGSNLLVPVGYGGFYTVAVKVKDILVMTGPEKLTLETNCGALIDNISTKIVHKNELCCN